MRTNTFIIVAGVLLAMLFQFFLLAVNIPAEAALSFQCGLLIADGKTPYIDFFEVSSPALMYLNAIPAVFSKIIPSLHPIIFFNVFVVALTAASCYLSALILFRQRFREQAHAPLFVIGFALLSLLMINEAGQREHLFLLLYIPFFVCRWLTWTNQKCDRRLSVMAGIAGGVSACLDPLCLLGVIAMEAFFLVSKLKFSPFRSSEIVAAVAVVALFFLHFAFFPTEYVHMYFNWALPLVLCDYRMWDNRLFWVNKTPDLRNLVYVIVFTIVFTLGLRRWCSLIPPCIGLCLLGLGLFIIEGKSMTYQALPMIFGAGLAAFLSLSVLLHALIKWKNLTLPFLKPVMMTVLVALCLAGFVAVKLHSVKKAPTFDMSTVGYSGVTFITAKAPPAGIDTFSTALMRSTNVNDTVLILNDRVRPAYPLLLQYNRKPGYLLTGYPMRMSRLLIDTTPEKALEYKGQRFKMYNRLLRDIAKKPKIIMLEKSEDAIGLELNEHELMETIDRFYNFSSIADWPDSDFEPDFDYFGFRIGLMVYRLKTLPPLPPVPPPVPVAPEAPAPAAPDASTTPPAVPVEPAVPNEPAAPNEPAVPIEPAAPAAPAPNTPPVPVTPVVPAKPDTPVAPAEPKEQDTEDIDPVTGLPVGAPIPQVAPPSP